MRWKIAPYVALLLGVTASAATFSSAKDGFRISAPAGWQPSSYPGVNVVFLAPQVLPDFRPNVNVLVQSLPKGMTQKQYHDISVKQLDTVITEGKIISQRVATLAGQPANELIYQGRQGKLTLYFHAVYAVKGQKAYILTGTTKLGSQAALQSAMKTFVDTFRFLP